MKKSSLELVIDALNNLEDGIPEEVLMLKKSDANYLKANLNNYRIKVDNVGGAYILKISKKEKVA